MMRREHGREHRDFRLQRGLHDPVQYGLGNEVVPVDPPVHDEPAGAYGGVAAGLGQLPGHQRDLEAAGHREELDVLSPVPVLDHLGHERRPAMIGDIGVPRGLYVGDRLEHHHGFLPVWPAV